MFFDKTFLWISGVASAQEDEDQLRALKYVEADCPKSCSSKCPGEDVIRNGISCQWMDEFRNELKRIIVSRSGVVIPFLKFPRNIRDMIYTYAMEYEGHWATKGGGLDKLSIHKDRETGRFTRDSGRYYPEGRNDAFDHACYGLSESLTPGLLRVNHQVYRESVQLLYGLRSFNLSYEDLEAFLECIGNSHVHLRKMDIDLYPKNPNVLYKLLNLDELCLDVEEISMDEGFYDGCPKSAAKAFFERAAHWVEGVGALHEGGRSAAIERIRPTWSSMYSQDHEDWCRMFKEELKKLFR